MPNHDLSSLSPEERGKCARFGRRCLAFWIVLCLAIYWISGHGFFHRSPALGWLATILVLGAWPARILSVALAEAALVYLKNHPQQP